MKSGVDALKRLVTAPLRMSRKNALVLIFLLAIFACALYLRLSVTLGHWLPVGRDGPYNYFHTVYLLDHYPSMFSAEMPAFFHFAAWTTGSFSGFGVSRITAFDIATALASGLVALTTFLMMRRLTKNDVTALVAAFFSAFIPASFRIMGELQKNAFGVALAPLAVLFLWRGLEGKRKSDLLLAGVFLGVVGLTHQLVFGTLVIAYISYLAFLLAYHRRIPWVELKAMVIVAIFTALMCGWLYHGVLGGLGDMAGEGSGPSPAAIVMAEFQQQSPQPQEETIYRFYDEYIGRLLLVLAAFGAGVAAYRRRATDLFLLAWGMSSLMMAQPWVVHDYQWRFSLMLATPAVLLAAVGLIEGIGALLWRAGEKIRALLGGKRSMKIHKIIAAAGRVAFLCLLLFVIVHQARISHAYSWTGQMLQPLITRDEYNALVEFRENLGDVYVFGRGEAFGLYWPDAVGLKGAIQGGEVVTRLSHALERPPEHLPENISHATWLATEWYNGQQQVNESIYALSGTAGAERAQVLENEQLFKLVFSHPSMRAYALRGDFTPGYHPPSQLGFQMFTSALAAQGPPPQEEEAPLVLRILLAPVYMMSGGARFVVGVPLTVLLWVLLPCLAWEGIQKVISGKRAEVLRKTVILGGVCVLMLSVSFFVKEYELRWPEGPPPGEGGPPPGLPHRILSATSSDENGLIWTKDYRIIVDRGSVPDAVFDGENIRVYFCGGPTGIGVVISRDGISWELKDVHISGLAEGEGPVDPDVICLPDGSYRMYYYGPPVTEGDPALFPGAHKICLASSGDGINFRKEREVYEQEEVTDPDVIQMSGVWRMFLSKGGRTISTVSDDDGLSFTFERELPIDGSVTCTVIVPGGYRIYYHRPEMPPRIYSAFSTNGVDWTEDAGIRLEAGAPGSLDEGGAEAPAVVRMPDGSYRMCYVSRYG